MVLLLFWKNRTKMLAERHPLKAWTHFALTADDSIWSGLPFWLRSNSLWKGMRHQSKMKNSVRFAIKSHFLVIPLRVLKWVDSLFTLPYLKYVVDFPVEDWILDPEPALVPISFRPEAFLYGIFLFLRFSCKLSFLMSSPPNLIANWTASFLLRNKEV